MAALLCTGGRHYNLTYSHLGLSTPRPGRYNKYIPLCVFLLFPPSIGGGGGCGAACGMMTLPQIYILGQPGGGGRDTPSIFCPRSPGEIEVSDPNINPTSP